MIVVSSSEVRDYDVGGLLDWLDLPLIARLYIIQVFGD